MTQQRTSVQVNDETASVYARRYRRYGFRSASAMMSAALVLVARCLTEPRADEWESLGEEIAREFGEHSGAQAADLDVQYRQIRNRHRP